MILVLKHVRTSSELRNGSSYILEGLVKLKIDAIAYRLAYGEVFEKLYTFKFQELCSLVT